VMKMPDQSLFLGDGVLSTTDNAMWREQRMHFTEAFLPQASLAKLFPINVRRAEKSMLRLPRNPGGAVVDMNEFLLHEAMAQLQVRCVTVCS
jgi:cytochrome P450